MHVNIVLSSFILINNLINYFYPPFFIVLIMKKLSYMHIFYLRILMYCHINFLIILLYNFIVLVIIHNPLNIKKNK
jgi:hypothetical protein